MNNWFTIITFTYPHEAHMVKSKLESEGMDVLIKDEFTAQVNNFYSNAIGGVKLQVQGEDVEKAMEILKESGYIVEENDTQVSTPSFAPQYETVCPYCNSENVSKKKMPGYIIILSILLLGIPLPFFKKRYHCFDCGKEWKIK